MSSPDEALRSIDTKLAALLAITVEQYLRNTSGAAKPRPRSIDKLLHDAGLTHSEIGNLLGKTRQAVSQILDKEKPSKGT